MAKVAVMTDSNSGITQAQAKELGITVLPMPFMINNVDYFEDINLTQEQFYQMLRDDEPVSTSQPSPENLMKAWDDLLKDHDSVVYIPMSSGLSGSCQSAILFAEDYDGKVQVVNNQRISVTQRQSVLDAMGMAEKGYSAEEIKNKLEETKFESTIYIMLDTLYYLKKGGRITPAAAALGTLLRLKPVLQIQGEKLDAFAKARTTAQGRKIMINAVTDDINKRFGGLENPKVWMSIAYTDDRSIAEDFKKEVTPLFPGVPDINIEPLSLSIGCHIGHGALAITATQMLDY